MPERTGFRPNPLVAQLEPSLIRAISLKVPPGMETISFGLGELPYPWPDYAQGEAARAMADGRTGYTPNSGLPELREAVAADFVRRYEVSRTASDVLITDGSSPALYTAFKTFLGSGDEVLIPELHYPTYKSGPQSQGIAVRQYPLNEKMIPDAKAIAEMVTDSTKLVVLNSPSNPTGQVIPSEALRDLAQLTDQFPNLYFLSDEIYSTFDYDPNRSPSTIAQFTARAVVIDGVSKRASMTGARLGWMIGPGDVDVMDAATKVHTTINSCAPTVSQYAAIPVLKGKCKELGFFLADLDDKRRLMISLLDDMADLGISYLPSEGAFYCFVDVSRYGKSMQVAEKLIHQAQIVTVPGLAFGERGDDYLRLSYAGDYNDITKGLKRMRGAFQRWL